MSDNNNESEALLLVDDNPTNLQVLYQTLETTGCKLLVAKNGETALAIAQKASPDLILLDIMMPGIDGFEVCRRLKDNPDTASIPVIFLSALTDTKDKVQGLQLGAVDYVSKPFQPDEVIARVNTHLTIHRLKREVEQKKDALEDELESRLRCPAPAAAQGAAEIAGLQSSRFIMKPVFMPAATITILPNCRIISGAFWWPMPRATVHRQLS